MTTRIYLSLAMLALLLLSACQSNRAFYEKDQKAWRTQSLADTTGLAHVVFLIGDAGEAALEPLEPNFKLLASQLRKAGENSTVVFLGDNIYPAGMPAADDPDRERAEAQLNAQLGIVKSYPGNVYFIPGNHDWNNMSPGGLAAVRRQEAYIETYLNNSKAFYPKNGCGRPKAIEVSEDLTIILVDSQWWLQNWDKEPGMHDDCKIESWEEMEVALTELVDEYDDGNILICMHHPVHTQGSHGGYFPLKEHIFPLTYVSKDLYIPLPVIGSLHPTARYLGITRQDPSHPYYQELIDAVNRATYRKEDLIIATGHEHSLQYFNEDDKHYIISGAGSKPSYTKAGGDLQFSASKAGFAKLYYYKNGEVWLEFLTAEPQTGNSHVIYRKKLKDSKLKAPIKPEGEFQDMWADHMPDSVNYIVAPDYYAKKGKQFLLGRNYRDAWATEVKLPVLNMDTLLGGLHPLRKGGGRQSKTMRLEAANGKEYVLRGLYKNAALSLPELAQGTAIEDIFQDQMSMDHPYGAQIIGPLADAVGVYHTNPRFFYLPAQPRLGEFNETYAGEVYLFEERPAKNRDDVGSFGYSEKIVSFRKMLTETREHQDHLIDQEHTLRSRLFDILIGDWDRHDDQWRWASFEEGDKTLYRPVPRDRDHAFLSFRGLLPFITSRKWAARQLQSFNHTFYDIRGLCYNARFFDRQYLNEQDLYDWIGGAEYMKSVLSDQTIEDAVRLWPEQLYALNGEEIVAKLKSRRDILPEVAEDYYRFLARWVDIPGTDERDRFEVTRLPDGKTRVQVFALNKKGEKKDQWYERTFDHAITKEIRLYGLKKDDEFIVTGESGPNSLLRIIGGSGEDLVRDDSSVTGGKRTKVYDSSQEKNVLELGSEARDLTSNDPFDNRYDREDFKYPKTIPILLQEINPDDGFTLTYGFSRQLQGFRKDPYKAKHTLMGSYAFGTGAHSFHYTGDYIERIGKWDITADVGYRTSSYVDNFFGLGNNSENLFPDSYDFNRMRYGQIRFTPGLKKRFLLNTMQFDVKFDYSQTHVERIENRISAPEYDAQSGLSDRDFDIKRYAGLQLEYHIDKIDHPQNPTRGLQLNMTTSWNMNINETTQHYVNLNADLAVYYQPLSPLPLTLAIKGGYAANWGNYEFFQANYLGRKNNLRGFRSNRFGGDRYLYTNLEGRLKLLHLNSRILPTDVGIFGFYDTGRVWHDTDDTSLNNWHQSWGGGIYLFAYDLTTITAGISGSVEDRFFELKMGFFF
ncbi:MAG: BamA/TamA family outer membrane protein [Saprospiraceae bacterium]|nr:BamA/TamA family outer membrane protein [Lewinella sp.]